MSVKIDKPKKFSEEPVVKEFLDGLGSPVQEYFEAQSDKWKREFDSLTKADQRKVLEFMEFLASKARKKKKLDK